ncbi:cyclin-D1-binding protein [Trifolium repens]|nr:cyclin-D1-binding protein [Trifolium repens]
MAAVRAEKERLNHILGSHLTTIHETLQVLDQTPSFGAKVTWEDVIKMSEQVSKQATTGFLLISYSSIVGMGPTLSPSIYESVKQVVDSSFRLTKETVSLYGLQSTKLFKHYNQIHLAGDRGKLQSHQSVGQVPDKAATIFQVNLQNHCCHLVFPS